MNLVCPVDGSEFSQWALESLAAIERSALESVTLLHVADTHRVTLVGAPRTMSYRGASAALEKAGTEVLKRAVSQVSVALSESAHKPHTKIKTVLLKGAVASRILECSDRQGSRLIVMGTRGMSDVKGFLMGSIARKVSALASCPVLIVKRPVKTFSRILLAVDGSKHSRAAAKFLRSGFLPETATVTIGTAVESPVTDFAARYLSDRQIEAMTRAVRERATDLVTTFREEFLKDGYTVTTEVRMRHVVDAMMSLATEEHSDLLVVGSRGLSHQERLHLGSVSEALLKYAPCAVLVVRGARA